MLRRKCGEIMPNGSCSDCGAWDIDDLHECVANPDPGKPRCYVRLTTSYWGDRRGLHIRQDLTLLRRVSTGDFIHEDMAATSAEDTACRLINLHECQDGVYEVVPCNFSRDWESGYIDDWDYRLVRVDDPVVKT